MKHRRQLSLRQWLFWPLLTLAFVSVGCDGGECEGIACQDGPRIRFVDADGNVVSLGDSYKAELRIHDPSGSISNGVVETKRSPETVDLNGRRVLLDPNWIVPFPAPGKDGPPTFIAVTVESEDWIGYGEFQPEYGDPCCPDLALERLTLTLEPKNPSGGASP